MNLKKKCIYFIIFALFASGCKRDSSNLLENNQSNSGDNIIHSDASDIIDNNLADSHQESEGFLAHDIPNANARRRALMMIQDRHGRDAVALWLQDHRGTYSLLFVDAETGKSNQVSLPFSINPDQNAEAVLLSSDNKLYSLFNGYFIQYDIQSEKLSYIPIQDSNTMAMSIAEDDQGRIWLATYPNNELFSYDTTQGLRSYGIPNQGTGGVEYPRTVAVDTSGWVYVATSMYDSKIYALNPSTQEYTTIAPDFQQNQISVSLAQVVRSNNQVYAKYGDNVYALYKGKWEYLKSAHVPDVVIGTYGTLIYTSPSSRQFIAIDMNNRLLTTRLNGQDHTVSFEYDSEGSSIMLVCTTDDNYLCGGARDPMVTFLYNPTTKSTSHFYPVSYGYRDDPQPNVVISKGGVLYVGAYPDGRLLSYAGKNFTEHFSVKDVYRPHAMVIHSSGIRLLGGHQSTSELGGGLVIERPGKNILYKVYTENQVIPKQAIQSMIELDDGQVIAGTTVKSSVNGTIGDANGATLFGVNINDNDDSRVLWSIKLPKVAGEGAETLTDMIQSSDGTVYIVVNSTLLYAFDPNARQIKWGVKLTNELGISSTAIHNPQSTRALVRAQHFKTGKEGIYLLLNDNKIAKVIDDDTDKKLDIVAQSPVPITAGGTYLNGRIYFGSKTQIYSWQVDK